MRRLLTDAKSRAKVKGFDFDLTEAFLLSIDRKICPYLEIPLAWGVSTGKRSDNSKSIDRIDSEKGYTKDNVIICSWKANRLLSDGSLKDLKLLITNFERIITSIKPTE